MREGKKERLENELSKILSSEEIRLLSLINIESRKDKLIFRMPKDVISLEDIWQKIKILSTELGIQSVQSDMYATLSELDDVLGDVKWLWKDWLPRGFVSMLVGDPGVGKSMVVLDLVDFITKGNGWPTCKNEEKPGNVIWIDTEASQQLLRMRARKMNIDRSSISIPIIDGDILGQVDIMNDRHREVIINMITDLKPSLMVVDSLGGAHTRGENKFEEIAPIMKFCALVARDENIGALLTHHLNKGQMGESPEVSLYRIRGSTAIPQFARSIMALEKINENEIKLRMIKSNLARIVKPLSAIPVIDKDGDIIEIEYKTYKAPPRKKTKQESCSSWAIEKIKEYPEGIRLRELVDIAETFGYTRCNLYAAKTFLGDRITVRGTGKESYWNYSNGMDQASVNQILNTRRNNDKKE